MHSYRHEFHFGNHADVLKHSILINILEYLQDKKKPFDFIDTHSGAGLYCINSNWSQKNCEYKNGIEKIWNSKEKLPQIIKNYIDVIKKFNSVKLEKYPGSPFIVMSLMKYAKFLNLFENHPSEIHLLKNNVNLYLNKFNNIKKNICINYEDSFQKLSKLLPMKSRRGLIFIDPSYENKLDYKKIILILKSSLQKFPNGIFMIWYPKIQNLFAINLSRKLENIFVNHKWLHTNLSIHKPYNIGMYGSGVFIINPPWTLYKNLQESLPFLVKNLGQDKFSNYSLKTNIK
ncbi:Ribosomal RNA large subunit methyltransferase J [Candidatus Kinetoplastibacterium sorsogonicusi]|uniref:Ribosomal RNA large subunit methyltransferase J n=1 Tax=Candidatus Kinetoplastidibacterium kentomonadis TaxID=1576550 RepID=A0A3Q8F6G8_9PROT|nr:23S rRNA (adenine(2030)-N(6))-methyltransferase RlmJ [Candidatus Kinetoplastibacterium sorsogonicusi]AWD32377.1 Ribosomal RNA large subunit methyltransferase J [Candidatus Kinetoplastibacterium sorsogonicusi]